MLRTLLTMFRSFPPWSEEKVVKRAFLQSCLSLQDDTVRTIRIKNTICRNRLGTISMWEHHTISGELDGIADQLACCTVEWGQAALDEAMAPHTCPSG
jgi:hypothetical protein